MRGQASTMAFCGVTAALAVVLMIAGGWLPAATYCTPVAASLLLAFAAERCGKRTKRHEKHISAASRSQHSPS